jgi:hypothetical protein
MKTNNQALLVCALLLLTFANGAVVKHNLGEVAKKNLAQA